MAREQSELELFIEAFLKTHPNFLKKSIVLIAIILVAILIHRALFGQGGFL